MSKGKLMDERGAQSRGVYYRTEEWSLEKIVAWIATGCDLIEKCQIADGVGMKAGTVIEAESVIHVSMKELVRRLRTGSFTVAQLAAVLERSAD